MYSFAVTGPNGKSEEAEADPPGRPSLSLWSLRARAGAEHIRVAGRQRSEWLTTRRDRRRTARRAGFREVEQQNAAYLCHGLRIALHRMPCADDNLGLDSVYVRTLIRHDAIVSGFDGTSALYRND